MSFLSNIAIGFLALYHIFVPQQNVGSTLPSSIPSVFETYLASQVGTADTSLTLASGSLRDGTSLSGYQCLTIDSNTPTLEYMCGTASGTSVTGLVRGIDAVTGTTSTSALIFTHRRGADVKITDYPILTILTRMANGIDTYPNLIAYATTTATSTYSWSNIPDIAMTLAQGTSSINYLLSNTNTWTGLNTYNTLPQSSVAPTTGNQFVNKTYADNLAISGAPNGSVSQKGIFQEATQAQIVAGTQVGSTGADLVINPSTLSGSIPILFQSTTSAQQLATTTITLGALQGKNNLTIRYYTPGLVGSASSTDGVDVIFNGDITAKYGYAGFFSSNRYSTVDDVFYISLTDQDSELYSARQAFITLYNATTSPKFGNVSAGSVSTTTGSIDTTLTQRNFVWSNITSAITSISFITDSVNSLQATGTVITVSGY